MLFGYFILLVDRVTTVMKLLGVAASEVFFMDVSNSLIMGSPLCALYKTAGIVPSQITDGCCIGKDVLSVLILGSTQSVALTEERTAS